MARLVGSGGDRGLEAEGFVETGRAVGRKMEGRDGMYSHSANSAL